MPDKPDRLLSRSQVATLCGVSPRSLDRWLTVKESPSVITAPFPPPGQIATRYERKARPVTGSRGRQDFPLTLPKRSYSDTSRKTYHYPDARQEDAPW